MASPLKQIKSMCGLRNRNRVSLLANISTRRQRLIFSWTRTGVRARYGVPVARYGVLGTRHDVPVARKRESLVKVKDEKDVILWAWLEVIFTP